VSSEAPRAESPRRSRLVRVLWVIPLVPAILLGLFFSLFMIGAGVKALANGGSGTMTFWTSEGLPYEPDRQEIEYPAILPWFLSAVVLVTTVPVIMPAVLLFTRRRLRVWCIVAAVIAGLAWVNLLLLSVAGGAEPVVVAMCTVYGYAAVVLPMDLHPGPVQVRWLLVAMAIPLIGAILTVAPIGGSSDKVTWLILGYVAADVYLAGVALLDSFRQPAATK
jgi:hypothetical protein